MTAVRRQIWRMITMVPSLETVFCGELIRCIPWVGSMDLAVWLLHHDSGFPLSINTCKAVAASVFNKICTVHMGDLGPQNRYPDVDQQNWLRRP